MNENINLCEILKGHESETFYSPTFGNIVLMDIQFKILIFRADYYTKIEINEDGHYFEGLGEICVFPSKENRDWNKWIEEQKSKVPKVPKTWSEYIHSTNFNNISNRLSVDLKQRDFYGITNQDTPIEKSALALLKIHQLIETGYGGNITNKEWEIINSKEWKIVNNYKSLYIITLHYNNKIKYVRVTDVDSYSQIAFHTKEQAEEFLKYPENIQLLKDYFMINE